MVGASAGLQMTSLSLSPGPRSAPSPSHEVVRGPDPDAAPGRRSGRAPGPRMAARRHKLRLPRRQARAYPPVWSQIGRGEPDAAPRPQRPGRAPILSPPTHKQWESQAPLGHSFCRGQIGQRIDGTIPDDIVEQSRLASPEPRGEDQAPAPDPGPSCPRSPPSCQKRHSHGPRGSAGRCLATGSRRARLSSRTSPTPPGRSRSRASPSLKCWWRPWRRDTTFMSAGRGP